MRKLFKAAFSPPSLKLNTTAICEVMLLLVVSLAVIFYFSREVLKKEAVQDAEQTLRGSELQVDNVLRGVEQSVGNVYWELLGHLDQPDHMTTYARELVVCNPHIMGCAISFVPNYYPDREQFMAYVQRKKYDSPELLTPEMMGDLPYVEQDWYKDAVETGLSSWRQSKHVTNDEEMPLLFCLPMMDRSQQVIGVMAVEVSVDLLSQMVNVSKMSSSSYCILIDKDGKYIINPDPEKRKGKTIFDFIPEDAPSVILESAQAMAAGSTGNSFFYVGGEEYRLFYKPFVRYEVPGRARPNNDWRIAVVYPTVDVTESYSQLIYHVMAIAVGALLLFWILCRIVFRIQLRPVRELTEIAESIAEGNFNEEIPRTQRMDEVGLFQQNFRIMQETLLTQVEEEEQLTKTLNERRETLRRLNDQAKDSRRVRVDFLRNVTNQMIAPSDAIGKCVNNLLEHYDELSPEEARREADTIRRQSKIILGLLDQMLNTSSPEVRKEDNYG